MKKRFRRSVAMLLAVVMILGLVPMIYAADPAEQNGPKETLPAETAAASAEKAAESAAISEPPLQTEGESAPPDGYEDVSAVLKPFAGDGAAPYGTANCQQAQLAVFWINNMEPNPDGVMDDYIYFEFPAGQKKRTGKMALYTVQIDGVWKTAYCIEPGINAADYYSTEQLTMDEWIASQIKTGNLTQAQMRAIGVVMLYGQIERPGSKDFKGLARMMATQVLVWEIAIGDRDPYPPYVRRNDTHIRRLTDGPYGVEITSLFLGIPQGTRIRGVVDEYQKIAASVEQHYVIPSFASLRQSQAPVIQLQPNGDGSYCATVTDTNGILDRFTFQNTAGLTFSRNGNSLTIRADGPVPDTVVAGTKTVPSARDQVYYVMYNGGFQHLAASVARPKNDPLPAYFRVTMPKGDLDLRKTTEDGKNLAGWKFGIYSDPACSSLVSGPHVSDGAGRLHAAGLNAGTYWVKELGHTEKSVEDAYVCESPNPQQVTVQSGQTASVQFHNKLNRGGLEIRKTTEDGKNLAGWKFGIYLDESCSSLVSGPHVSDASGSLHASGLRPGTYWVKELGHTEKSVEDAYACESPNPQQVTVQTGQTAVVQFHNRRNRGGLEIRKTTEDGKNLAGWKFGIYLDQSCSSLVSGPHVSDASGSLHVADLKVGTYWVKELGHTEKSVEDAYACESPNPQQVTVQTGKTAVVQFHNKRNRGGLDIRKTTEDGKNLAGWKFGIYSDPTCLRQVSGPHVSDASGSLHVADLNPGTYWVKELGHTEKRVDDAYVCDSPNPQKITVQTGRTATVRFYNRLDQGGLEIRKTTEDGKNLAGWKFGIYSDPACLKQVSGPHVTDAAGRIHVAELSAGTFWVKELGHTDSNGSAADYECDGPNPQRVRVQTGKTATVSFYNRLKRGSLRIRKQTSTGKDLGGWKIGLYLDSACREPVSGSPFTTAADGTVKVPDLRAGTYYAREIDESAKYPYWEFDSRTKTVEVKGNRTAAVTFQNTQLGDLRVRKHAHNGSPAGWNFQILNAARLPVEKIRTGPDGYAHSGKLKPGTYYVREIHDRDGTYWEYDAEVTKRVTVTAGAQAEVTYTNTQYGRIEFHKTTNTRKHLEGWTFEVRTGAGELVGQYQTDRTGHAVTGKLAPGRYYVKETASDDPYWSCDVTTHTVDVTAGKTAVDKWNNTERGKGIFHKTTNTGDHLQGWEFTVYRDLLCLRPVGTLVTGSDGAAALYLEPGTYYVKETGDQNHRLDDSYWKMDSSVKILKIRAHEDSEVSFANTHFGRLRIIKTMRTEGPLNGWQFRITDAGGQEVKGSPFASGADGQILTGNLLPGTYTVEELIPQDSPFRCESQNPQTIAVIPGKTAEVPFENALRSGRISIQKKDVEGRPLAGARFLLEWSRDGRSWAPISYAAHPDAQMGTCSNPKVQDGCLVSGADGLVTWEDLHPGAHYRITETAAPEGYTLLTDYAFCGQLPEKDLTVSLNVVNTRTYELPRTGSASLRSMPWRLGLCAAAFLGGMCSIRKKKE